MINDLYLKRLRSLLEGYTVKNPCEYERGAHDLLEEVLELYEKTHVRGMPGYPEKD